MTQEQVEKQAKAEKAEYARAWRSRNKDRTKKYTENYWLKRAERRLKAGDDIASTNNENH